MPTPRQRSSNSKQHRRPKPKDIISPNPIGSITPRGTKSSSNSFMDSLGISQMSGSSRSAVGGGGGGGGKGGSGNNSSYHAFGGGGKIHIPPPPSAERGASKPFLNKPTLPTHSFFLPALPAKNVVIASEQPVSARDTAFPPAFAALEQQQQQQSSSSRTSPQQKPNETSSSSPTTSLLHSPRIRKVYGYPELTPSFLDKVLYELCLEATYEEGHLFLGANKYCNHPDISNDSSTNYVDRSQHDGCLHTMEEEAGARLRSSTNNKAGSGSGRNTDNDDDGEIQILSHAKTQFLLPERVGDLGGVSHDRVLANPKPGMMMFADQLYPSPYEQILASQQEAQLGATTSSSRGGVGGVSSGSFSPQGPTTLQRGMTMTRGQTPRTPQQHLGSSRGGVSSSSSPGGESTPIPGLGGPLFPTSALHNSTFAKALSRLDLRPPQIQKLWEVFEGDRSGFVAVKTIIKALQTLLTDEDFQEQALAACFSLFTRPESQGVVLKEDLDSKRVAVTERGGCTRAMIVSLTRAIAQCQRFPSDRRRFISSVEFRRFMLGEEGTLGADMVVAFLPVFFRLIDELRVLQRRGD